MDKRYQVFVSSTYNDLIEERKEATQAILKCNCFPAGMELFPASNKQQWNVIKQVIDDSDFYLLIIAGKYGSLGIDDTGKKIGYTEMEFDYALSQNKPIIAMIHRHPETLPTKLSERTETRIKRLERFRNKAMDGRMVAFWENKDQLHSAILDSLHKIMASTPDAVGWIRTNAMSIVQKETDTGDKKFEPVQVIERFNAINDAMHQIEYLEKLKYNERLACFSESMFLEKFVALIDVNQSDDMVCRAIGLIPRYGLDYETKQYLANEINIKELFQTQQEGTKIRGTNLSASIIGILNQLYIYSFEYASAILNFLKEGGILPANMNDALTYIGVCYRGVSEERKLLCEYIKSELESKRSMLPVADLITILTVLCDDEKGFSDIYNVFINSSRAIQKKIIYRIFDFYGADIPIVVPRIQRMFFDMCETVFSWNDEEITADMLLFCLFTRTYDIYTVDEVYEKLESFNDDVFYMFVWQLSYGEFGRGTEEVYEFTDDEKSRVREIIRKRKHPREKKLLEQIC